MYIFNKTALLFLFALLVLSNSIVYAQYQTDSLQHLPEVVVTSAKTYREVIPAQKLTGDELKTLNSFSVADAIRYFSGVQIKDYGGIGGLKTVNV
ncbi:MAG: TonB-dependent receptor, partial [Dysgonamonadaceae bacterium]